MDITIDKEFQNLLRTLNTEELTGLEGSILEKGCLHPLTLWGDILIDGHHRLEICNRHGIKYDINKMEFASRDEAIDFIYSQQSGRRNYTDEERDYYRGKHYEVKKKLVTNATGKNQYRKVEAQKEPQPQGNTSERLGRQYGVGHATIKRNANFAKAVDRIGEVSPEAKSDILAGKVDFNKRDLESYSKATNEEIAEVAQQIETGSFKPIPPEKLTKERIDEEIQQIKDLEIAENHVITPDSNAFNLEGQIMTFAQSLYDFHESGMFSIIGLSEDYKNKITEAIATMETSVKYIKKIIKE